MGNRFQNSIFTVLCIIIGIFIEKSVANYRQTYDYCHICPDHIACNNNWKSISNCTSNANFIHIDPILRNRFLDEHNRARNLVAKGRINGYNPAKKMAYLQWDPELANLAKLNTQRCFFGHDTCHKTERFKKAGQNISIFGHSRAYLKSSSAIRKSIRDWFNEHKQMTMAQIKYHFKKKTRRVKRKLPVITHFTQMVRDKSDRVGCAISQFPADGYYNVYVVCNYAVTNMQNEPIYIEGQTASSCRTGIHYNYTGLCSPHEKYIY